MDLYNNLRFKSDQPLENDLFRVAAICKWGFGAIFFNWKGVFWQQLWYPGVWDWDNGDKKLLLSMLYMPQPSCKHPTFVEKAPKPVEHKTVTPKWADFTKCQPIQPNFLDSSSHPYKRVHPSVHLYVGPLCLFLKHPSAIHQRPLPRTHCWSIGFVRPSK